MSAVAALRDRPGPGLVSAVGRSRVATAAPFLVVALAAGLRFAQLSRTALNPFYDASVRSMGESWHALLTGAIDPSAGVAIDKPPVDLWLQVASTKLLGFTPFALLLPAAIGGVLSVVAVYDLVRTLAGRTAALVAALVLAVLPVAVITARGDTMDSVMAALVLAAFAIAARGMRDGRTRSIVAAGALFGLAFEVKLFEGLVAAPALALLWWLGAPTSARRRLAGLAGAGVAFAAVALAWLVAVTLLVPAAQRPYAFGSTNGSAWNATFVYDGWDRLTGAKRPPLPAALTAKVRARPRHAASLSAAVAKSLAMRRALRNAAPAQPGVARLLSSRAHLGARLGIALAAAWLALALVAALRGWRGLDRPGRAGLAALAAWLALGTVLFSTQTGLRPRYLEAMDGAVAATFAMALMTALAALRTRTAGTKRPSFARRRGQEGRFTTTAGTKRPSFAPWWGQEGRFTPAGVAAVLAVAAVVVPSAAASVAAVRAHVQDSGTPGAITPARLDALSAYLRAHRGGARYEAASVAVTKGAALIAHDGQPVLLLDGEYGRPLVSRATLARLVNTGAVRYALVGNDCSVAAFDPRAGCSPAARWIRAHGTDVSLQAGQRLPGLLYALQPGQPVAIHTRHVVRRSAAPARRHRAAPARRHRAAPAGRRHVHRSRP